ncbi:MAG: AsmA-like C-terminal domain-containing protein [Desulfuromonadales bacterium]|nr:AsmA-like C-terminal domain-containing protein [Desulfuromonadales bacterium]
MQKRTYIKFSGILLLIFGTLIIGVAVFLPRLLDINAYRDEILATLQQALNRKVNFSSGTFAWHFGPSFDFKAVVVKEPDGSSDFLKAERITVRLALVPLLEKQVVLKDVIAEGAEIQLVRDSQGRLNIDDLLKPSGEAVPVHFHKVQLRHSTVLWRDMKVQKDGFQAAIRNISLNLEHLARGSKGTVKLSCEIPAVSGPAATLSVNGTVKLPEAARPLTETELNGSLDIKQAEVGRFWPYYQHVIPFASTGGRLDIASSFKGRLTEFVAKGRLRASGAALVWPKVFHYTVAPRSLQLNYDLRLTASMIDIPAVELTTDGFRIKGSFRMHDYAGKDPRIIARASTPATFRYEDIRGYVPYGIIPAGTSDYIEHKIKSGIFKLDTGVLDGRVSQITHMETGENYKTLLIRGPVEKAVLSYGPKAPVFSNIKGTIELKDKNFNLIGMTALFGESPLKLNGSITEYNTDKTSDYPVRMEVTPHSPEVAWLARIAGASKLEFGGASTLVLNGSGHYSAYRLNGGWDLKTAIYSFPGAIRKPSGMSNHLDFSSVISSDEIRLTSLAYSLSPLMMSATALLKYGDQPDLKFELQTNQFTMSDALPILSDWQKYHPRGRVKAHIAGSGDPEDFSAMNYIGTIALNAFSVQPDDKSKPVSGINGSIAFKGNSLETSSLLARYGDSLLTVKGKVTSLKNHEAQISLTSPQLYLRDINRAPLKSDLAIRRLSGTILVHNDRYEIKDVAGQLNSSNFNISGIYSGGRDPKADVTVTSSRLDVDDLLLLTAPFVQTTAAGQSGGVGSGAAISQSVKKTDLKLKLAVEAGKYGRLPFSRLNAVVNQESGIVYLQSLEAGLFGGRLIAKGRVAPGGEQSNRYDLNFKLERVDADHFLPALDITREVTGALNVQGDVTARGDSMLDIKKTALGNIKLKLENGTLRKFNVLSKMFSILNVSQLLKFQLPDMVADGMPYKDITGSFAISDGVISTQDLFINSNAINISVLGKADMVREDLDFTIGVQPLQSVDKVVNRIPVVGWLLTGKGKDFLTVFFEAKGKWADPRVTAIPAKTIGKGVLNVFRRVFELPVRMFTDTGEVFLGK